MEEFLRSFTPYLVGLVNVRPLDGLLEGEGILLPYGLIEDEFLGLFVFLLFGGHSGSVFVPGYGKVLWFDLGFVCVVEFVDANGRLNLNMVKSVASVPSIRVFGSGVSSCVVDKYSVYSCRSCLRRRMA